MRKGEPVLLNDRPSSNRHKCISGADRPRSSPCLCTSMAHRRLDVVNKAGGFWKTCVMSVFANQAARPLSMPGSGDRPSSWRCWSATVGTGVARLSDSVLYSVTLYANAAALARQRQGEVAAGYLSGTGDEKECAFAAAHLPAHPPVLEAEGLVAILQARLARSESAGLQTQFRVKGSGVLSHRKDLYWIAQEALNNVRKHAAAQHVTVHLRFTAAAFFEVIDDGVGFDLQAVR